MIVRNLLRRVDLELQYRLAQLKEMGAVGNAIMAEVPWETEDEKRTKKRVRELQELTGRKTKPNK